MSRALLMLLVGVIAMCGLADEAMTAPCRPNISFTGVGLAVDRNFNACDVYFPDIPPTWGGLYRLHGTRLDNQAPIGVVDGTSYAPKPDDLVDTVNARYGFTFDASTGTYTIRLLSIRNEAATSDSIVLYSYDRNGTPYGGETAIATQTNTISVTLPNALPAIGSVSPTTGSPLGGTSVVITGTGFAEATSVKFGGTAATSFTVDNESQITAVAPAGAVGPADIVVATAIGSTTFPGGFNYVVSAPGAPTIGAVTTLDPDGAQVNFTPPANNGGGAITEYVVTSSPHGKIGVGTQSPISVRGLWSGMSYTFTVTAKNAAGVGPSSSASQAVVPRNFQTIGFSPGPQTFGTTPVLSAMNTSGLPVVFSSTTPDVCTVTPPGELTFHSAGTCTISADAEGNSAYFPAQTITRSFAVNPALPDAPTIGAVTTLDPDGAQVNFTPPANNGGGAITEYVVTSSPHGKIGVGTQSPISVRGLWSGMSYTFTVTAKNAAGVGPSSSASQAVVPRNFQTIGFSPGPQTFGTTPVLSAMNTSGLPVVFSSTTPDVCTVTPPGELTFHSAGTCTISADAEGNSAYFPAQTITRSFAVNPALPGAPTIGAATAGDEQAEVSFVPPASSGGAPVTYTVTADPDGATGTGAQSPITVAGLTNGVAYTFSVTATNAAGTGSTSAASNSITPVAAQAITFINPGAQNFGTAPILTATSDSGLSPTFTSSTEGVCTVTSSGELTFVSAGICTINALQAGDAAHLPAAQVSQSFAVNPVMPGPPLIGGATAGDTQATITFTAPASDGGAAVRDYTVTVNPGGATFTASSSPIIATALSNGATYTFTVTANNAVGMSAPSAASNAVTPVATQFITFANPGSQTAGTSSTLTATTSSGLSPVFTSITPGVCTITGATLTSVAVGTCTITVDQPGNEAYLAAPTVTQSFEINPQLPAAGDVSATVAANSTANPVTLSLSGGAADSVAVVSAPSHGSATASGTSISYTPEPGYSGADSFTYTAMNVTGTSAPATVTVTVSAPTFAFTPAAGALEGGAVGRAYSQPISAANGMAPYRYAVSTGALPAGLHLDASTGAIVGMPTAEGIHGFTIVATDANGASGSASYTIAIGRQLPAAGDVSATVAANSAANPVTLSLSGGAVDSVAVAAAPSHGSTTASGTSISYTPEPGYSGADSFTYTAMNVTGTSPPATVTVTVSAPTFAFTPAAGALEGGAVGRAYSQPISAANGMAPYRYAVSTGALPAGLRLDASTGAITGTPTAEGSHGFAVTVTDANGASGSASYTVAIGRQLPAAGDVSATVAANSTANPITLSLSGGAADSAAVAAAPSHGSATASGTSISYTPDPGYSGADSFTYTATNVTGTSAPATVAVMVSAPTFAFTPATGGLEAGAVGRAYNQSISAANGMAPYRYAVSTGALPAGPHLDASTGAIVGMPTAEGIHGFTILATDANGASGSASYTIAIGRQLPAAGDVSATVAANSTANPVTLSLSGGAADSVAVAAAPSHGSATASGTSISYTPDPGYSGADSFTYTATNVTGTSASATVRITVAASKLTFSPAGGDLPDAMVGEAYLTTVTAKGGQGGILYSLSRGKLPKGMILNVSTGELSGPLDADVDVGTYSFTVAARDATGNIGEASYRLAVKARGVTVVSRSYTLEEGDTPRNVYLNEGATGGPFTGAEIAFVSPPNAGKAEIIEGELATSGAFVPVGYYLKFTPNPGFFGTAVIGYRLESALGASDTGTVSYAIVHNGEKVAAEIDGLVRDFVRTRQNLLSRTIEVPGLIERRKMGRAGNDPISTSMSPSENGITLGLSTSLAQLRSTEEMEDGGEGVAAVSPFNVWIDGAVTVHQGDENDGRWGTFGLISAGADYLLSEKALIGLSFHFDRMTDPTDADAELTGNGWLAGPYASFELGSGVFLDTSLLYGGSWNDVGTKYFDGSFDTRRLMWDTKLQGQWQLGDATVLTPALRAVFLKESVDDYSVSSDDGSTVELKGFTEDQLRLSIGADLERVYRLENGLLLTPRFGGTAGFAARDNSGAFGTVSAGLNLSNDLNWDFDFSLLYGIESEGEQAVGVKAGAHVRF